MCKQISVEADVCIKISPIPNHKNFSLSIRKNIMAQNIQNEILISELVESFVER